MCICVQIGTTPLHAVAYGDPKFSAEIIELLINSGANIDVVDNVSGVTILNYFIQSCNAQDGDSALNKAAFCGNLEAAKALMKFGANVSLSNQVSDVSFAMKGSKG